MADTTNNTALALRIHTAVTNLHAKLDDGMSANEIKAISMVSYVWDALDDLDAIHSITKHWPAASKATSETVKNALESLSTVKLENIAYPQTVHLLNCISEACYIHVFGTEANLNCPAIIFAGWASAAPRGDYLSLEIAPGYYAYVGTFSELQAICRKDTTPATKPGSEVILVGEHRRPRSSQYVDGQLDSNLSSLKCYKVGLPKFAYTADKSNIRLATLNASGMIISNATPWSELKSWIAREKMGAPMFISVEVAGPAGIVFTNQALDDIRERLLDVEQHGEAFDKASLNGKKGTFMADFDRVTQAEIKRIAIAKMTDKYKKTAAPAPTNVRHDFRHDAESIFWVFLWSFTRAQPLSPSPETDQSRFNWFCQTMFEHSIGGPFGEVLRSSWMQNAGQCAGLFHPTLSKFEELFISTAGYLAIPWYLYSGPGATEKLVQPDHAHTAFRRFTLAFLLDPANRQALEIELDTATLRFTTAPDRMNRKYHMSTVHRL